MKRNDAFRKFSDRLSRQEGPLPLDRSYRILEGLWLEGVRLGVLPPCDPWEGIETDIRLAGILNSCSKKSS